VVSGFVLLGALNRVLLGRFGFDLVGHIFGPMPFFSRLVYSVVGICAIYEVLFIRSIWRRRHVQYHVPVQA